MRKRRSNYKIRKLKLRSFRGATTQTEIELDHTKKLALIYGCNGDGKSTLVDALDFICNQHLGSIKEISGVENAAILPLGGDRTKLEVGLTTGNGTWTARLKGSGYSVMVEPAGAPCSTVLRRNKILGLINAAPGERYKELIGFIDIEGVEKAEGELRKAVIENKKRADGLITQLKHADDSILQLYHNESQDHERSMDPLAWAKQRASADNQKVERLEKQLASILGIVDRLSGDVERADQQIQSAQRAREAVEKSRNELVSPANMTLEVALLLIQLLTDATIYLQKNPSVSQCPLCENTVSMPNFAEFVQKKLERYPEIQRQYSALQTAEKHHQELQSAAKSTLRLCIENAAILHRQITDVAFPAELNTTTTSEDFPHLKAYAGSLDAVNITEPQKLLTTIGPDVAKWRMKHGELRKQIETRQAIANYVKSYDIMKTEAEINEKVTDKLIAAVKVTTELRISYTQELLDQVADECDRLYGIIHPDENLGNVRFALDKEKRASCNQTATFEGHKKIAPQAYFSESHLDTLGIAFFLAVTKHRTGGKTILVLDDVFTSVDEEHVDRLINLLVEEADYFDQIIVTTHFRRLFDQIQVGHGASGFCDLIKLRGWSFHAGIQAESAPLAWQDLEDVLNAPSLDRQGVAAKAGVLLESALNELTIVMRCRVERNRTNHYALRPMIEALSGHIGKWELCDVQVIESEPAFTSRSMDALKEAATTIKSTCISRNTVGAHFNPDGSDYSNGQITDFGNAVLKFLGEVVCGKCGSLPRNNRKTHHACTCGSLILKEKMNLKIKEVEMPA